MSTPASDFLAERALAVDEQLFGVQHQPRGQVGLKWRGDVPLAHGARGENHRTSGHHALSPVSRRPVAHAELTGARVLGHAGGGSGGPSVRQLLLE
eukprot:4538203-Prymnesium_polylepis.1